MSTQMPLWCSGAGFTALLICLTDRQPTRRYGAARAAGLTAAQVQGALDALAQLACFPNAT